MSNRRRLSARSAQSGQAIVIIALSMIVLLGFVVLAIDGGNYYNLRRGAQNAADVSALAGVHYYYKNSSAASSAVLTEIDRVAGLNGIPSPSTNVTAYWLDEDGNYVKADNSGVI